MKLPHSAQLRRFGLSTRARSGRARATSLAIFASTVSSGQLG
jgi:hypothetical protein